MASFFLTQHCSLYSDALIYSKAIYFAVFLLHPISTQYLMYIATFLHLLPLILE